MQKSIQYLIEVTNLVCNSLKFSLKLRLCNIKYVALIVFMFMFLFVFFTPLLVYNQPVLPQRSINVQATQPLNFGSFVAGTSGGTVTVSYDGSRTSTGSVYLLPLLPAAQPAIFEIKLCHGRNISITFSPSTVLSGSNGGVLTMDIGPTEKGPSGSVFSTIDDCNFITPLRVGGKLILPPGNIIHGFYTGSFDITFNQE